MKFSPNLGDGLLSECLEEALIVLGAAPDTRSIDLAARKAYGDLMTGRNSIMKFLDSLPPALRGIVVRAPLKINAAHKWRPHYAAGLQTADAAVIGGGNLISDIDLNFPTKLTLALDETGKRKLPTAIYACGMATGWSRTGLHMCREAFARPHLQAVFLRDADSGEIWDELMAPHVGHKAQVVRDPGLMASDIYPPVPRPVQERRVAGLGVMSHIAIRYHAEHAPELKHLGAWYVDVARGLIAEGFQVRVFTNGSPEDRAYLAELYDDLRALGGAEEITFITQRNPRELCGHISQFDVMVAYRMHAIIAAYSYGVPAIGLAWDRKLESFMNSVDRADYFLDVKQSSAADCATLAIKAADAGISPDKRKRVLAEARADVAKVYLALGYELPV